MRCPDMTILIWLLIKLIVDAATFMYLVYRLKSGS
jgi:hypothetical protein